MEALQHAHSSALGTLAAGAHSYCCTQSGSQALIRRTEGGRLFRHAWRPLPRIRYVRGPCDSAPLTTRAEKGQLRTRWLEAVPPGSGTRAQAPGLVARGPRRPASAAHQALPRHLPAQSFPHSQQAHQHPADWQNLEIVVARKEGVNRIAVGIPSLPKQGFGSD